MAGRDAGQRSTFGDLDREMDGQALVRARSVRRTIGENVRNPSEKRLTKISDDRDKAAFCGRSHNKPSRARPFI